MARLLIAFRTRLNRAKSRAMAARETMNARKTIKEAQRKPNWWEPRAMIWAKKAIPEVSGRSTKHGSLRDKQFAEENKRNSPAAIGCRIKALVALSAELLLYPETPIACEATSESE